MLKARVPMLLGLAAVAAFVVALYWLFQLRFASGDVYPPYSTFRADPLGAKALHEAARALPELEVSRLIEPLRTVTSGADTTLFVLGMGAGELRYAGRDEVEEMDRFMNQGGRIVLALLPEPGRPWYYGTNDFYSITNRPGTNAPGSGGKKSTKRTRSKRRAATNDPPSSATNRLDEFERDFRRDVLFPQRHWGFALDFEKLPLDVNSVAQPVTAERAADIPALPPRLDWRSAAWFAPSNSAWRVVYARGTNAVLIERKVGSGSLVLVSDAFFTSNESLRTRRETALLLWLMGGNRRLIFDETHHGVALNPGIATLARRYRLHGFAAGLLLLAGLFVWRNAAGFLPPHEDRVAAGADVAGRDSAAGFVNLLRRSVAPRALIVQCLDQWRRDCARHHPEWRGRAGRMAARAQSGADTPVETYRELSRIAKERHL